MKVLLINGSPNSSGSTYVALNEVSKSLENEGIEVELVQVGNIAIRGCIACRKCKEIGMCVFDDIVNEIAVKFKEADALVIGSPVYYASANGTMISFLDRLFYSTPSIDKSMKVGASVVVARRGGCTATFDELNKYFTICGMPVAPSQYWNMLHGHNAETAVQDLEGLQTMRTLGKNIAFLIKAIKLAKDKYGLPEKENIISTNFIR